MSLGKDLASIRKSKNLTLEDIQNAIKIPLDTLKSIENNSIFKDPTKNKTYVRSFVRSYAKVLKLDDDEVVQALDEMEAGSYTGSLLGGSDRFESESELPDSDFVEAQSQEIETKAVPESESKPAPAKSPSPDPREDSDMINWADMGRKFTTASKKTRAWLFMVVTIVIALTLGAGYFYWDDLTALFANDDDMTQESVEEAPSENLTNTIPALGDSLNSNEAEVDGQTEMTSSAEESSSQVSQEPITLGDTLTLDVYAAYGQLEPVRITSDLNWRTNPFWMENGEAYHFDFKDTLLVRGQYSRMLLLFNGHVIENPRQNYFNSFYNSIMITRSVLDQEKYLAPAPSSFPLQVGAPDSIVYRIRF